MEQALESLCVVPTRIIGAMEMIDGGETDTKLITVIDCDPRYKHINKLEALSKHTLLQIRDFFENYKNLQDKTVEIKDIIQLNEQCRNIMNVLN